MAIILVEQFFNFAYDLGDRFLMLERGRAIISGPRADVPREMLKARLAGLGAFLCNTSCATRADHRAGGSA